MEAEAIIMQVKNVKMDLCIMAVQIKLVFIQICRKYNIKKQYAQI
jgi:hypothetical protein